VLLLVPRVFFLVLLLLVVVAVAVAVAVESISTWQHVVWTWD
jgi:hypothetical protein